MADETYPIPENPVYDPVIREIQDTDKVNAEAVVNPVIAKMIANTHAVKLHLDRKELTDGHTACRFVVGSSKAGWTEYDVDYLCDGTADDVELNAALAALPDTGGEVYLLDGEYSLDAPVTIAKAGTMLRGCGAATCLKWSWASSDGPLLQVPKTSSTVRNLKLDGNREANQNGRAGGLSVGSLYVTADGVIVENCGGNAVSAHGNYYSITNCIIRNNRGNGMLLGGSYGTIEGCLLENNELQGMYVSGLISGRICGNLLVNQPNDSLVSSSRNTIIFGNVSSNNGYGGFSFFNSAVYNTVFGNVCCDNEYGISLQYNADMNVITGNVALRGNGTPEDYASNHSSLEITNACRANLIAANCIMGKDYVTSDDCVQNTILYNKYN